MGGEVVVGERRRGPKHDTRLRVGGSLGDPTVVGRVAHRPHVHRSGLDHLAGLVVAAGEGDRAQDVFGRLSRGLADEVLGHESARCRARRSEGEGATPDAAREVRSGLQPGVAVGDEVRDVLRVFLALSDGPGPRHRRPDLHSGEAAKPRKLDIAVPELLDGGRVVRRRYVVDRNPETAGEILGDGLEFLAEPRLVLIRDGREPEDRRFGAVRPAGREGQGRKEGGSRTRFAWDSPAEAAPTRWYSPPASTKIRAPTVGASPPPGPEPPFCGVASATADASRQEVLGHPPRSTEEPRVVVRSHFHSPARDLRDPR